MNTLTLILASVLTTCVAQVLYALITLKNGWYSTPVRWTVAVLFLASSGGALWFVLLNLTGGESLVPPLVFVACQALAGVLVVGSGLRGIVHSASLAEERAKRVEETTNEANQRLKNMEELADGVRQRLEEHDTQMQSDRDRVKNDLGAEQSKVRDALGEEQGTVRERLEQDTNTRIREMQERGQHDQPEERTDRREGHEHRSDIDARLRADTETRSQERQDEREERAETRSQERKDDREERAKERQDEREERADERRDE